MSVGSTNDLGTNGGPEVERVGPESIPGAMAQDYPGLSMNGTCVRGESINVTNLRGCWGPETLCAALSVRLNYCIKCEAASTYQIIDELNYSSLSNHTGLPQK